MTTETKTATPAKAPARKAPARRAPRVKDSALRAEPAAADVPAAPGGEATATLMTAVQGDTIVTGLQTLEELMQAFLSGKKLPPWAVALEDVATALTTPNTVQNIESWVHKIGVKKAMVLPFVLVFAAAAALIVLMALGYVPVAVGVPSAAALLGLSVAGHGASHAGSTPPSP